MATPSSFQAVLNKYYRFVNQVTFQKLGTDFEVSFGDTESAGLTQDLTDIERFSREFPEKSLSATHTIQKGGTLSLTLFSLTETAVRLVFTSNVDEKLTQTAVPSFSKTINNLVVGRIYNLGHSYTSITSSDDGAVSDPIEFVEGVHYLHISDAGRVQLIAIPSGATKWEIEGSAATVDAEDQVAIHAGMSGNGEIGILRFYGVSDIGTNFIIEVWRSRIRTTGELSLQGADDYGQVTLEAKLLADETKPVAHRFFTVTERKALA